MSFYKTCSRCGVNLDPGEPCDCQNEKSKEQKREFFNRHLKMESRSGQLAFVFDREDGYEKKMCI